MSDEVAGTVIDFSEKFDVQALIKKATARAAEAEPAELEPEEVIEGDAGGVPSLEEMSPLPRPGDPYKAYGRPSGKPLATLCLLKSDGTVWSYPYSCRVEGPHLVHANDAAKTLVVVLRFSGIAATEITLEGRKLEQLVNYLGHHRIAWVREQAKGKIASDGDAPVVTRISIKELK